MSGDSFLPFTRPSIDEDTIAGVAEVLRSGWITSGPKVKEFEAELSSFCGGRPVRVLNSGTAALEIGLRIAGVGPGDEVITTPLTWVATSNVVLQLGARPVFVDVDPATRNIDLSRVEAAITPKTRAILPVYLAGLPVDLDRLYAIAGRHKLRVVEDACQAFGSTWKGTRVGARGDLIAFSFHANKNLTTAEGGAIVLPGESDIAATEKLRLQGVTRFGEDGMDVDLVGGKFNLTDVAARIGLGSCGAFRNSPISAARWRATISPVSTVISAANCLRPTSRTPTGTCSRWCSRSGRSAPISSRRCASGASGSACTIPQLTCFLCTVRSAGARASIPMPSVSAPESRPCRSFRR